MADSCQDSSQDGAVQNDTLSRLEQYGDSWLDDSSYKNFLKKSRLKSQRSSGKKPNENNRETSNMTDGTLSRRQRKTQKQKFKICDKLMGDNSCDDQKKNTKPLGIATEIDGKTSEFRQKQKLKNKKLEKLKTELGLYTCNVGNSVDTCTNVDELNRVGAPNSGTTYMKKYSGAEIVVFKDPAKRKKKERPLHVSTFIMQPVSTPDTVAVEVSDTRPEMNLRDARYDVHKFGIKGFEGQRKETAVHDMLVKLGAKPPKKKGYNYKDYMSTRKQEIVTEKERREMDRKLGLSVSKRDKKRKRKDGGPLDGQIGSYRRGVQVLNRDDIQRVKKLKVKK